MSRHRLRPALRHNALHSVAGGGVVSPYLVQDTFSDTNGTSLDAHTPNVDTVGGGWTEQTGTWDIQSNRANIATSVIPDIATIDAGQADVIITATIHSGDAATNRSGLIFRWQDSNNYWWVDIQPDGSGSQFRLVKSEAGSATKLGEALITISPDTDYTMQVTLSGSSIAATLDGASEISTTDSFLATQTVHGLRGQHTSNQFDDLAIEAN